MDGVETVKPAWKLWVWSFKHINTNRRWASTEESHCGNCSIQHFCKWFWHLNLDISTFTASISSFSFHPSIPLSISSARRLWNSKLEHSLKVQSAFFFSILLILLLGIHTLSLLMKRKNYRSLYFQLPSAIFAHNFRCQNPGIENTTQEFKDHNVRTAECICDILCNANELNSVLFTKWA